MNIEGAAAKLPCFVSIFFLRASFQKRAARAVHMADNSKRAPQSVIRAKLEQNHNTKAKKSVFESKSQLLTGSQSEKIVMTRKPTNNSTVAPPAASPVKKPPTNLNRASSSKFTPADAPTIDLKKKPVPIPGMPPLPEFFKI